MEGQEIFLSQSRGRILKHYEALAGQLPTVFGEAEDKIRECGEHTALALKYLYGTMPLSDIGNYPFETFRDYAEHGVMLWETRAEVRALPEDIFLNYVLYHRINEEEITPCRTFFYEQLKDRTAGLTGKEAALEVNYWCVEEVTYQCTDDRTLSSMAVYRRGNGRCGEESTFSVNAMRSIGIPSRQVYAPKWSHCDDNHAWVEIWCDGTWYFTGACEPVPILNKGWFTNASSRAMMVHSRWFDFAASGEEAIGKEGMVTMLNELRRYAAVKEMITEVEDTEGNPVQGARVFFEVLNYSEYAPIADGVTDAQGRVTLSTGLGSLHIAVSKNGKYADAYMDTRKDTLCKVCLEDKKPSCGWTDTDMIAPVDTPVNTDSPTKEQTRIGNQRLEQAVQKRTAKIKGWCNQEREAFLKGDGSDTGLRKSMLEMLTEKDQTDCVRGILEEHLEYALPFKETQPYDIFTSYILNPRVGDEVLTRYRKAVLEAVTEKEQELFKVNPGTIWNWIEERVQSCPEYERTSVITVPAACLKLGIASPLSKKILFVAIARTLGIPARLNPGDGAMEYMQEGRFRPVLYEKEKNCRLTLHGGGVAWKYFQNWSMARLEEENYTSLRLGGTEWEEEELHLELESGRYRILTSNRLPNGNIFASQYEFELNSGEDKCVQLRLRDANLEDMLENIEIPEFTLQREDKSAVKASELTADGKHILMWLEVSKEPTEHILNEMMEQSREFAALSRKIIFVLNSKEALNDPTLSKALDILPDVQIYYDSFTENVNMLGRRMYVDHEKLPLIIVTEGQRNGVYATSGYNVGTGGMLLRIMGAQESR